MEVSYYVINPLMILLQKLSEPSCYDAKNSLSPGVGLLHDSAAICRSVRVSGDTNISPMHPIHTVLGTAGIKVWYL